MDVDEMCKPSLRDWWLRREEDGHLQGVGAETKMSDRRLIISVTTLALLILFILANRRRGDR